MRLFSCFLLLFSLITLIVSAQDSLKVKSVKKNGRFLPVPILSYSQETRLQYGISGLYSFLADSKDSTNRPSALFLSGSYTQNNQLLINLYTNTWSKGNKFHNVTDLDIRRYPYFFYGIGDSTKDADKESIENSRFKVFTELEKVISTRFYAGLNLSYQQDKFFDIDPNSILDRLKPVGIKGGRITYFGLSAIYDTRDAATYATKGDYLKINISQSIGFLSNYVNSRIQLQSRNFRPINSKQALGLHTIFESLQGDPPFYELRQMGNYTIMRGYYSGRYRDQNYFATQLEYRYRPFKRWGLTPFVGTGTVFNNGEFSLSKFKPNYGLGLRYFFDLASKLTIRIDYGFGEKPAGEKRIQGLYIAVSEAF